MRHGRRIADEARQFFFRFGAQLLQHVRKGLREFRIALEPHVAQRAFGSSSTRGSAVASTPTVTVGAPASAVKLPSAEMPSCTEKGSACSRALRPQTAPAPRAPTARAPACG